MPGWAAARDLPKLDGCRQAHSPYVGKGNLCVIDDADGQRVLAEIESRRAQQFRSEYDFMPEGDSPEQHRARFKWLHKEGALSDEEFRQRMATVDALDPARMEQGALESGMRLN